MRSCATGFIVGCGFAQQVVKELTPAVNTNVITCDHKTDEISLNSGLFLRKEINQYSSFAVNQWSL